MFIEWNIGMKILTLHWNKSKLSCPCKLRHWSHRLKGSICSKTWGSRLIWGSAIVEGIRASLLLILMVIKQKTRLFEYQSTDLGDDNYNKQFFTIKERGEINEEETMFMGYESTGLIPWEIVEKENLFILWIVDTICIL